MSETLSVSIRSASAALRAAADVLQSSGYQQRTFKECSSLEEADRIEAEITRLNSLRMGEEPWRVVALNTFFGLLRVALGEVTPEDYDRSAVALAALAIAANITPVPAEVGKGLGRLRDCADLSKQVRDDARRTLESGPSAAPQVDVANNADWMRLSAAANEYEVGQGTLSKLVKRGKIKSERHSVAGREAVFVLRQDVRREAERLQNKTEVSVRRGPDQGKGIVRLIRKVGRAGGS